MASYIVSGAGEVGYDGLYLESGTFNGQPSYQLDASHWLFWVTDLSQWALGPGCVNPPGTYAYLGGAEPTGSWTAGVGSAPAPTVTLYVPISDRGEMTLDITSPVSGDTINPGVVAIWCTVGFSGVIPDGYYALNLLLWLRVTFEDGSQVGKEERIRFGGAYIAGGGYSQAISLVVSVPSGHSSCSVRLSGIAQDWPDAGAVLLGQAEDVEASITIAGDGTGEKPRVTISAPANTDVVSGAVEVHVEATDTEGLASLALSVDDVEIATQAVTGTDEQWVYLWDTTGLADGLHFITATATDTDDLTETYTVVVTVDNGVSSDLFDPVVTILAPEAGDVVSRQMIVRASITDNVAVVRAECFVEGISQGELLAANAGGLWRWVVDLTEMANGSRALSVEAWDAAGNHGYATLALTVENSLAAGTWYLFSEQGSAVDFATRWRSGRNCSLGMLTLQVDPPPANPASRLNLFLGVHVPGTSTDFDDYQSIEHMRAHGYLAAGETLRWAIKAVPQQVLASWETGVLSCTRLREWDEGLLLLEPESVMAFDGQTVEHYAGLTGYGTGVDLAWWNGKIVVALGAGGALFLDPDAGQEPFVLEPLDGCTQIDVVEAHGTDLYLGARVDGTDGMLWKLSEAWDLVNVGTLERVTALASCGTGLGVGCAGGKVYSYNGTALNLALATGEATIERLALVNGLVLAGTGDGGAVYRSLPGWTADGAFGSTTVVNGFGALNGRIYAGGDRDVIWYRIGDEDWGQAGVLSGVTAINDMLVWQDGLYMATTGASEGKLWRLEVAPDSTLVSGTRRPLGRCYEVLRRA